MKVYSIGREADCEILINDLTSVVSRRHATLNVSPFGKMTITDFSQNGTYVNGIRISQNIPFPVTRKDTVSFAHVAQLDWNCIPNPLWYVKYVIAAVIVVCLFVGGLFAFCTHSPNEEPKSILSSDSAMVKVHEKELEQQEKAKQDSITKDAQNTYKLKTVGKKQPIKPAKKKSDEKNEIKKEQENETTNAFKH